MAKQKTYEDAYTELSILQRKIDKLESDIQVIENNVPEYLDTCATRMDEFYGVMIDTLDIRKAVNAITASRREELAMLQRSRKLMASIVTNCGGFYVEQLHKHEADFVGDVEYKELLDRVINTSSLFPQYSLGIYVLKTWLSPHKDDETKFNLNISVERSTGVNPEIVISAHRVFVI